MERKIEEQLLAWKNKTDDRLPLIVNGATLSQSKEVV